MSITLAGSKGLDFMKRLVITLGAGVVALLIMGFAFIALTETPVAKQEIVRDIEPSASAAPSEPTLPTTP